MTKHALHYLLKNKHSITEVLFLQCVHVSIFLCVCSGVCREGDRLVVGPTDEGKFLRLKVCSMQRNRSACRVLRAGQAATLALGNFDRSLLRKVKF